MDVSKLLGELDHGRVNEDLSEQMADVIAAVQDTGKVGKLVITVSVTNEAGMAIVGCAGKSTVPRADMHAQMYHFDIHEHGNLTSEDQRQGKLPLAEPEPKKENVN